MKKFHLVYLGLSGFPYGLAPIQRQKLISKSLISLNWDVSIICNRGVHTKGTEIKPRGMIDGIYYEYLHGPFRRQKFLERNYCKIISPIKEFFTLVRLKKEKGITAAIVTDRNLLWDAVKYRIFSVILGFSIYLNLVELYKERPHLSLFLRFNDAIFNRIGCYFYDGIIPISRYLMERIAFFEKKTMLIPIITDALTFQNINGDLGNHVLYCGSASYFDSILVVLNSFAVLKNKELKLILVVGGSKTQLDNVQVEIDKLGIGSRTNIKSNISDFELNTLYVTARALLLPLFDTIQDNARFPHKFGEYLASGSVVITNKVGEIKYYLSHMKNVIFANNNEPGEMAYWIDWVEANFLEAKKIGNNGREIAIEYFDYRGYSEKLSSFLAVKKD